MRRFFELVKKELKVFLWVDGVLFALGLALCFLVPHVYTASATFTVEAPKVWQLEATPFLSIPSLIPRPPTSYLEVYAAATTPWVMDRVIERENLKEHYGKKSLEDTRKEYLLRMSIKVKDDGFAILEYRDRSPEKACRVCNQILKTMNDFYCQHKSSHYSECVGFLKSAKESLKKEIKILEDSLDLICTKYNFFPDISSLEEIKEISREWRENIIWKELRYRYYLYKNPKSPETKRAKEELDLLYRGWIDVNLTGIRHISWLFPVQDTLSQLFLRLARFSLLETMKREIYAFIEIQLNRAIFQKDKTIPMIHVIDPPVIPEKRSFPKRKQMMMGFFIIAMTFNLLWLGRKEIPEWFRLNQEEG